MRQLSPNISDICGTAFTVITVEEGGAGQALDGEKSAAVGRPAPRLFRNLLHLPDRHHLTVTGSAVAVRSPIGHKPDPLFE